MTAILLTSNNVAALKHALRSKFPGVLSSHMSEALAFGLGYKTNIALRSDMRCAPSATPLLGKLDHFLVTERLSDFGAGKIQADFLAEVARSPEMPDRIWTTFQNGDIASNNWWFHECQRRGIPMVFIQTRRKYVQLNWDCITIDPSEEGHVRNQAGNELGRLMFTTFQKLAKNAPGKPFFEASSFVGSVNGLLPETAYDMADTFFEMLYLPTRRQIQAA